MSHSHELFSLPSEVLPLPPIKSLQGLENAFRRIALAIKRMDSLNSEDFDHKDETVCTFVLDCIIPIWTAFIRLFNTVNLPEWLSPPPTIPLLWKDRSPYCVIQRRHKCRTRVGVQRKKLYEAELQQDFHPIFPSDYRISILVFHRCKQRVALVYW